MSTELNSKYNLVSKFFKASKFFKSLVKVLTVFNSCSFKKLYTQLS